jgi:hypothetical protein
MKSLRKEPSPMRMRTASTKKEKRPPLRADDFHEIRYSDMDSWLDDFKKEELERGREG